MYTAIQSAIAVDFTLYKIKLLLLLFHAEIIVIGFVNALIDFFDRPRLMAIGFSKCDAQRESKFIFLPHGLTLLRTDSKFHRSSGQ